MSNKFMIVCCLVTLLGACSFEDQEKEALKDAKRHQRETNEMIERIQKDLANTLASLPPQNCEKAEEDLVTPTGDIAHSEEYSVVVERTRGRVIRKDCSGQVISDEVETLGWSLYEVDFKLPEELNEPVHFVSIENHRTCQKVVLDQTFEAPQAGAGEDSIPEASISAYGDISFYIVDSNISLGAFLPAVEGLNQYEITYYGECQVDKEGRTAEMPDSEGCETAPILARGFLTQDISVKLVDASEPIEIDKCETR